MSHEHDSHKCPPHYWNCDCPEDELDEWACNPYWDPGHCPDGIEREEQIHAV